MATDTSGATDGADGGRAAAPPRVLVAEDEGALAFLLEQFLAARGWAVTVCGDGRAAVERLRDAAATPDAFAVAVVDVQMPGLDGVGVLRAARALPLGPEVVLATGNATLEAAQQALRHGAFDAVAKPYRMAQLELVLRRAAGVHALRRERAALRASLRAGGVLLADGAAGPLLDRSAGGPVLLVDRGSPAGAALRLVGGAPRASARDGDGAALPPDDDAPAVALAAGGTLVLAGADRLDADARAALAAHTAPAAPGGARLVLAGDGAR